MPSADLRPRTARRRIARRGAPALCAVLVLLGLAGAVPVRSAELPSRSELSPIVETLRADPDLQMTRRAKVLRLKPERPAPQAREPPWWVRWMKWTDAAFAWFTATARWVVWVLGALALALLAVSVRRWARERADAGMDLPPSAPSHIGPLDVRPESLPDRIGAHARALWQRGEHRAALSLLYRGALSRLIHVYRVPIRAAHTESECVRLAQDRVQQDLGIFFARLVSVWQLAVYGGRAPEAAGVLSLCDQFDLLFAGSTPSKGGR